MLIVSRLVGVDLTVCCVFVLLAMSDSDVVVMRVGWVFGFVVVVCVCVRACVFVVFVCVVWCTSVVVYVVGLYPSV